MGLVRSPQRYSSLVMPKVTTLLIDETPFVYLTRNDGNFDLKVELARFIEMSRKKNSKAAFKIYSTRTVKAKLGFGFFYNLKNAFTRNANKKKLYQKRLERQEFSKTVICSFLPVRWFFRTTVWNVMDLHLFANENKRETLKRPLLPQEVISLDMCTNALIAYRKGYPIFSFNEDYQYFIGLPLGKESPIQYWKPLDILKNLPI